MRLKQIGKKVLSLLFYTLFLSNFCCQCEKQFTMSEQRGKKRRAPEDICQLKRESSSELQLQQRNQSCVENFQTICDPDQLLDAETRNVIEFYTSAITRARITVALIAKMDEQLLSSDIGVDACSKVYADAIFKQLHAHLSEIDPDKSAASNNSIGNNSLVIFLSTKEGAMQVSFGDELSPLLPAAALDDILRSGRSYIRRGRNVPYGIESSIIGLDVLLSGGHGQIVQQHGTQFMYRYSAVGETRGDALDGDDNGYSAVITLVVFFVVFIACIITLGKYLDAWQERWKDKGRATLRTMVTEVLRNEHAGDGRGCFVITCAECLEPYIAEPAGAGLQAPRRKVTLEPCHHEVCSSCLVGMLGLLGARVCPICRSPIVRYHHIPEAAAVQEVRATQLFETRRDDLCHRLRRVYERFPGIITEKWLGEATLAVDRGTLADFERVVPVSWRRAAASSSSATFTATESNVNNSCTGSSGDQ